MSRERDFTPMGWAVAASAFFRWLGLRLAYIIAAFLATVAGYMGAPGEPVIPGSGSPS